MRWRIQNLDNQINSKRTEQSRVREKNRELQLEIIALDERSTH
jgi:hypothetical protein